MTDFEERLLKQLTRQADALTRIADRFELVFELVEETPPTEVPVGCQHPEESRVPLGMTKDGEAEWECRDCRHHHPQAA